MRDQPMRIFMCLLLGGFVLVAVGCGDEADNGEGGGDDASLVGAWHYWGSLNFDSEGDHCVVFCSDGRYFAGGSACSDVVPYEDLTITWTRVGDTVSLYGNGVCYGHYEIIELDSDSFVFNSYNYSSASADES